MILQRQHHKLICIGSHNLRNDIQSSMNISHVLSKSIEMWHRMRMLWNFDETNFNIEMAGSTVVLMKYFFQWHYTSSSENRTQISFIKTINVISDFLSVFHILSEKCLLANWFLNCHSDDCLAVSDSDYSNELVALEYIKKFNEYSACFQQSAYRLLLDNHDSHCIHDFIEYCNEHKIISYALSAHTTHLMQFLDVTLFQLLKCFHIYIYISLSWRIQFVLTVMTSIRWNFWQKLKRFNSKHSRKNSLFTHNMILIFCHIILKLFFRKFTKMNHQSLLHLHKHLYQSSSQRQSHIELCEASNKCLWMSWLIMNLLQGMRDSRSLWRVLVFKLHLKL